ncbi:unnamed protein product [Colletotrichum noveboracense]|uniref:Uncharacterized protein n=1 Tax=Colletotrichum noveboracense TaxID=2664923 RepID=A0A9W4RZK5_9PEZI|nr:unnamed protein product [Colletotrichum noveboracense]
MINHRWPVFHRKLTSGADLTVQYIASGGTIYQIFQTIGGPEIEQPVLEVTPDLLIRNLDFIDGGNEFNQAEAHHEEFYAYGIRGNCLIREHENGSKKAILSIQALDEKTLIGQPSLEFVKSIPAQSIQDRQSTEDDEPARDNEPAPNDEPDPVDELTQDHRYVHNLSRQPGYHTSFMGNGH